MRIPDTCLIVVAKRIRNLIKRDLQESGYITPLKNFLSAETGLMCKELEKILNPVLTSNETLLFEYDTNFALRQEIFRLREKTSSYEQILDTVSEITDLFKKFDEKLTSLKSNLDDFLKSRSD